jgi:hypothetical protein
VSAVPGVPAARAADFQAAWYFSLLVFSIGVLVVAGVVLAGRWLRPMWRQGDRATAVLVGSVAGVAALFFTLILVTVAVGLAPATVSGGR